MPNAAAVAHPFETPIHVTQARIAALPNPAREKLEHLRKIQQRSRVMADGLAEEMNRVREMRGDAEIRLGMHDRNYGHLFDYVDNPDGTRKRVPAMAAECAALVKEIEGHKAELERLRQAQANAQPGFSYDDILGFLRSQSPSAKFAMAPVKIGKADTLASLRDEQSAIASQLEDIRNAGATIAEAKAAMRAQVAAFAEAGRPDIGMLLHGGAITWPTELFTANGQGHEVAVIVAAEVKNSFAFTVWANQGAIVAQLDKEIEAASDDTHAMSAEEKAARVTELEARLIDLQRVEEAVIEKMEAAGQSVTRQCRDPLVLLGINQ